MNTPGAEARPVAREKTLGPRIIAGAVDFVLLVALGAVMTLLFGESTAEDGSVEVSLSGIPFIAYILLVLAYYFGLEAASGQTLGKRAMGLKVVSLDGSPLTPARVFVRTLLRFVDGFAFYLVAIILIATSKNDQRLGDMAAGTTVVRA